MVLLEALPWKSVQSWTDKRQGERQGERGMMIRLCENTLSGSYVSCSAIQAVKDQLDTGPTFLFFPLDDDTEDSMVELLSNSLS